MVLIINLLNFRSENLAGVGYFVKRIFEAWSKQGYRKLKYSKIIVLSTGRQEVLDALGVVESELVTITRFPVANNIFVRIFYEQLIIPFICLRWKGTFFSPTPAIPLILRLFRRRMSSICTVHDLIPFFVKNKYKGWRGAYVKFITKASSKMASHIITVSERSKADISRKFNIKSSKISVIYNFLLSEFKEELVYPQTYFLTISTIEPSKGLIDMMKGFDLFVKSYPEFSDFEYIIIGGKGWDYEEIFKVHAALETRDKIRFLGYVSDDIKQKYISECMGIFLLSQYEGFGIPILEGMYSSKPSIISIDTVLEEVAADSGLICHSRDSEIIAKILKDFITNRNFLKANIPKALKKFDPKIQIDRLNNVLNTKFN